MARDIAGSVVIITGASSGIGRAVALEFARRKAHVYLVARRTDLLHQLALECQEINGGHAIVMPTDMTDEKAVHKLALDAEARFGGIDTWVNNHGVAVFGLFEDIPMEDFRRVIEVDLFGVVHGVRAALPLLRKRGGGTIINVGSVNSWVSEPYQAAYIVAKHGVRALGMALRQELSVMRETNIHICTVMPPSVDTPLFQHAANYTGHYPRPLPPVYRPEHIARIIVRLAQKPRNEVFVGAVGKALRIENFVAPSFVEKQLAYLADKKQLEWKNDAPKTPGNIYAPMREGTGVGGGWITRKLGG